MNTVNRVSWKINRDELEKNGLIEFCVIVSNAIICDLEISVDETDGVFRKIDLRYHKFQDTVYRDAEVTALRKLVLLEEYH